MVTLQTVNKKWFGKSITFVDGITLDFNGLGLAEVEDESVDKLLEVYEGMLFNEGEVPEVGVTEEEKHKVDGKNISQLKDVIEDLKGDNEDLQKQLNSKDSIIKDYKADLATSKEESANWKAEFEKANDNTKLVAALEENTKLKAKNSELEQSNKELTDKYESAKYESELLRLSKNDVKKL